MALSALANRGPLGRAASNRRSGTFGPWRAPTADTVTGTRGGGGMADGEGAVMADDGTILMLAAGHRRCGTG
jgi:hypothetical protein